MNMKYKILITVLLIILILLIVLYFVIGNYFYNISLNPKTDKKFVLGEKKQTEEYKNWLKEQQEWLSNNSSDVYINSTNNGTLKLHAYEINNNTESNIWAIVMHGYMGQGNRMTAYTRHFFDRGYNVLMVDLRGHGLSEGDYIGMGWHDRLDIIDWINYIINKDEKSQIVLFGVSMGAATTMMTTGEELPSNVKVAISDCGYTSAWEEFGYKLKQLFNLPNFPVLYAASNVCSMNAKYSLQEASAIEQVKKSKTPTLFIHGSIDDFVPFEMLDELYNAATCEKEKLVVEGAGHGLSSSVNPELYWNTIYGFIEKYVSDM